MSVDEYLSGLQLDRRVALSEINAIIISTDKNTVAKVGMMMGKEMILYHSAGYFIYGLTDAKAYMSLHLMPIYGSPELHVKYKALLPRAKFQKGCINFKSIDDMPSEIVKQLISDAAKLDWAAIVAKYKG